MDKKIIKKVKRNVILFAGFWIILLIFSLSTVITYPNEYSVIKQFGNVVRIDTVDSHPYGLGFKIPFLQTVTKIDRSMAIYDLPPSGVLTKDKKSMVADCFVLWNVTDVRPYLVNVSGSQAKAEDRISANVFSSLKNVISKTTQEDVINGRNGNLVAEVQEALSFNPADYGMTISAIETKRLDLPDENKQAVYERMISERQNIEASYRADGEKQAQLIKNETNKAVTQMLAEANQKADEIIAEGQAEYMRILSDAYNDEDKADFYEFVRQLDAMEASMKNGETSIVLDKDSPLAELFYHD